MQHLAENYTPLFQHCARGFKIGSFICSYKTECPRCILRRLMTNSPPMRAELDSLKTRFPTPWTTQVDMSYLTAKMLRYTTFILRLQVDRSSREILMRNALSVAIRIAYLTEQGLGYTSTEFPELQFKDLRNKFLKNYYNILILSTAFLISFFVLTNAATPEDQELARKHVALAQNYLKRFSAHA